MRRTYLGSKRDLPGRLSYHGTAQARISLRWLVPAPLVALLLSFFLGGCSIQLSSLLPGGVSDQGPTQGPTVVRQQNADVNTTGSIPLQMTSTEMPAGMSQTDWPHAQGALKEALSRTQDGPSVAWNNPTTGARGTVTPIASAFEQNGFPCRNFLASHVMNGIETWSEGTACRVHRGEWEVKNVKPVKKT